MLILNWEYAFGIPICHSAISRCFWGKWFFMSFLHVNEVTYDIRNQSWIYYWNENRHVQVDKFNKIIGKSNKKYQNEEETTKFLFAAFDRILKKSNQININAIIWPRPYYSVFFVLDVALHFGGSVDPKNFSELLPVL